MKSIKILVTAAVLLSMAAFAFADARRGSMMINGSLCEYDTLRHYRVGPGVTYTQFQFNSIPDEVFHYTMRAHVLTIDLTNPYNKVAPYMARNQYYAVNTQVQQYNTAKKNGLKPIASVNGYGFVQSNDVLPEEKTYETLGSFVVDGIVKHEDLERGWNYYMDSNRIPHFGYTKLDASVSFGGKTYTIGTVNRCRDIADNVGQASLFCNGMKKSFALDGTTGVDVLIEKIGGEEILTGENKCKVISVVEGSNTSIGSGQAILSSSGEIANAFRTLTPGKEITINLQQKDAEGNNINVTQLALPYGVSIVEGKVRKIGYKNTPFPAIGYSKDKKTLYLTELEISKYSSAPYDLISELMVNIGVWDACYIDGGPSTEMEIDGEWVTINSVGQDFNGRYIANGNMIYSVAPDDSNVSTIEVDDPSLHTMSMGESFSFQIYGYNKYGEKIMDDVQNTELVSISCTNDLGTVENGVFTAKRIGEGSLNITLSSTNNTIRIPIRVKEQLGIQAWPKKLFTGEFRECQAKLYKMTNAGKESIDPTSAKWWTDNSNAVQSCQGGLICPYMDGFANVYVEYAGMKDTIVVTVENLEDIVDVLDLTNELPSSGHTYNYQIPSVPNGIAMDIAVANDSVLSDKNYVTLFYQTGETINSIVKEIPEGTTGSIYIPFDFDALDTYPATLLYSTISGKNTYKITSLKAYYGGSVPVGIEVIENKGNNVPSNSQFYYNLNGQRVNPKEYNKPMVSGGKVIWQ